MKKNIYRGIVLMFSLFLASVIIVGGLMVMDGHKTEGDQAVDYLIVLGARLYWDKPSPSLEERLKVAQVYLSDNKKIKVIVSGGEGSDEKHSEAYAMKEYLLGHGIEEERIILEDQSTNTFQNLDFSLKKIREVESKENIKILIASNKYHIFRAKMIARRLGMTPYGLPAEIPPTVVLKSYVREYFAVLKSFLLDRV